MRFNFGEKRTYDEKESKIILDDAKEIFDMFNEANITLTGEAKDIVLEATDNGFITQENLTKLLEFLHEAQKDEDE